MKLLLLVVLLTGATAHSISRRAVKRFGNAFECNPKSDLETLEREPERNFFSRTIHPLSVYRAFGCFCPEILRISPHEFNKFRCCENHKRCYEEAKKLGDCKIYEDNRYDIPYYYFCSGRKLICRDKNNACQDAICNCDRNAASCLLRAFSDTMFEKVGLNTFC
ncbi:phospholipase A2-like isoform X2 [Microtus oregoni]|uniref:phospholipase A2-like isoform X2 n=1 Tax=Microtus oregoni TaxID=111838 RepID=UPI001BB14376|nr:phospholipase A2-like isoform X2 [Microtus oregoni]XP_041505267.1 phospholipase A2-like isoform X2 [Microtus oregoni]